MSHYIHHVPGRLRVRTKAFRCDPAKTQAIIQELKPLSGIYDVKHNDRNGSLTIHYDPASGIGAQVTQLLSEAGCLSLADNTADSRSTVADTFGKAVIAAVAQQTVIRSFNSLASVLL